MVEIKKFLGQNQLRSVGLPTGIGDIQQQFIGSQISNELITLSLINKNIIDNNRNVGFRGHVCYKCFSYWIDLVHNNKDEGMKSLMLEKPPDHTCDIKKVLKVNESNFQDLASKKNQAYDKLSDLFTSMVSGIILFGQKPIHLNIEELDSAPQQQTHPLYHPSFRLKSFTEPQNDLSFGDNKRIGEKAEQNERQLSSWIKEEDCIDIGNINEIKESHWTYRAIKEEKRGEKKSIIIDGGELIDFVRTARATFGTFRVQMGEDAFNTLLFYVL